MLLSRAALFPAVALSLGIHAAVAAKIADCARGVLISPDSRAALDVDQEARFVAQGDGTVLDRLTGLQWQKCVKDLSGPDCTVGQVAKYNAFSLGIAAQSESFARHADWRVPTYEELETLYICPDQNRDLHISDKFPMPIRRENGRIIYDATQRSSTEIDPISPNLYAVDFLTGLQLAVGHFIPLASRLVRTAAPPNRGCCPMLPGTNAPAEGTGTSAIDEAAAGSAVGDSCERNVTPAPYQAAAMAAGEPAIEERGNYVIVRYDSVPSAFVPPIQDDLLSPRTVALQIRIEGASPCSLAAIDVHRYPLGVLDTSALLHEYSSEERKLIDEDIGALEGSYEILDCMYRGVTSDDLLHRELFWYTTMPALADPVRLRARVTDHLLLQITPKALANCPPTQHGAVELTDRR